jgi:hypothetical protein
MIMKREYKRFLQTQKLIRGVDEIHIIDLEKKLLFSTLEIMILYTTSRRSFKSCIR